MQCELYTVATVTLHVNFKVFVVFNIKIDHNTLLYFATKNDSAELSKVLVALNMRIDYNTILYFVLLTDSFSHLLCMQHQH